ncbi:hypothetical protein [Paraburkholderia sacchari]|uniref:hypothetical protein n=1 Tax=Paraburkholderia sacchari TaxID=159450 RepID=UPI001BCFE8E8|nr:hypothetical protein [Paraburkholderia sacchari]
MSLSPQKPAPEIDNPSRIAAMPPARKSDLIATLLRMDQFNELASRLSLTLTTRRRRKFTCVGAPQACRF